MHSDTIVHFIWICFNLITCLYPCPIKRARNVIMVVSVELLVSFVMANSGVCGLLGMEAAARMLFASGLPNKRAPWMYLHLAAPGRHSSHFTVHFHKLTLFYLFFTPSTFLTLMSNPLSNTILFPSFLALSNTFFSSFSNISLSNL